MSFRTVNGNQYTEDGWRCVDRNECDIVRIPSLTLVDTAPIRRGAPLTILGAWLFWYDRHVEEITSSVWGWSESNDVLGQPGRNNGSNHLGGTAIDVNAPKYPWGARVMPADRKAKIREGLALFRGAVFWGEDWNRADQMHYQMSWPEGDPRNDQLAADLRAGYLGIYVPGATPAPTPILSRADGYAVKIIQEGQRLGITPRGIQIGLSVALVETNLTMYANSNDPPSLQLPHDAVGSDHMSSGLFQQQTAWGTLADRMDATRSATIFFTVDHGPAVRGLTKIRQRINGRDGALWDYNDTSRSPGFYAQTVQGSEYPTRYDERFNAAVALYNRLANNTTPVGDDMAQVPQAQWDAVYLELSKRFPSRSPLRHLDQTQFYPGGLVDTFAGMTLNDDGMEHVQYCIELAKLNHPPTMALLNEVAGGDSAKYPDRADDIKLAQAILHDVAVAKVARALPASASVAQPQIMVQPQIDVQGIASAVASAVAKEQPAAPQESPAVGGTIGQRFGAALDALDALKADLSPAGKATIDALAGVLKTEETTA